MAGVKHLSAVCPHCGGAVNFPATDAGMPAACPHCGNEFELLPVLDAPSETDGSRRGLTWAIIGIVLMLLALALAVGGLMYFRSALQSEDQAPADSILPSPAGTANALAQL